MISIVDTDVLVGLFDKNDALHSRAKKVVQQLAEMKIDIAILPTTLGEFVTLSTIRMGRHKTQTAASELLRSDFIQLETTPELTRNAVTLYLKQTSKEESLFDCYNMVAAQRYHADCIFSFDRGYTKNGFVLAQDFVKKNQS